MKETIYLGITIGTIIFLLANSSVISLNFGNSRMRISKYGFISVLMLSIVIIGMCANDTVGDARAYNTYFRYLEAYGENPWDSTYNLFTQLVLILMKVTKLFSYGKIRALILLICWLTIVVLYRNYCANLSLTLFLYMVTFTFAHDGVQIKNFVAVTLLLSSCYFLVEKKENHILKFFLLMIPTIFMHFSCFVYLSLPLIEWKGYEKNKKKIPFFGLLIYVFMFAFGTKILTPIIYLLSGYFPILSKAQKYMNTFSGKRSLVYLAIYLLIYYILLQFNKIDNYNNERYKNLSCFIFDVWNLMGAFIPLLLIANAVFRLYRNLLIIIFIVLSNGILSNKRFAKKRMYYSILVVLLTAALLLQPVVLGQAVDVFAPVFEGQFFWNY